MEQSFNDSSAYKNVKTVSIVFIILSSLVIFSKLIGLFSLFLIDSYKEFANNIEVQEIDMNMSINSQLALKIVAILISLFILVFSINLIKYKESARKGLINSLIVCIIFFMVSPILSNYVFSDVQTDSRFDSMIESMTGAIMFLTYFWAIAKTIGFIFVIRFLNKGEVKQICS